MGPKNYMPVHYCPHPSPGPGPDGSNRKDVMSSIILYATPNCPHCLAAKKFLEDEGVQFEYVNVAIDRDGLRALREKSGQMGVPVLDAAGHIVIGFKKEKFRHALQTPT
jgi:glutaredoxin